MAKKYFSTKTYRQIGPVAYRQRRADSHCNLIHGYAMSFHFEFEADTLDARNWVTDFGGLKPLKEKLEENKNTWNAPSQTVQCGNCNASSVVRPVLDQSNFFV